MIKNPFANFLIWHTSITVVLWLAYSLLVSFEIISLAIYAPLIFLTQYILTLLLFYFLLKALAYKAEHFVLITIIAVVLKLLIYGGLNFFIIYSLEEGAHQHVVLFFILYIFLTGLELGMMYQLGNSRSQKKY